MNEQITYSKTYLALMGGEFLAHYKFFQILFSNTLGCLALVVVGSFCLYTTAPIVCTRLTHHPSYPYLLSFLLCRLGSSSECPGIPYFPSRLNYNIFLASHLPPVLIFFCCCNKFLQT